MSEARKAKEPWEERCETIKDSDKAIRAIRAIMDSYGWDERMAKEYWVQIVDIAINERKQKDGS